MMFSLALNSIIMAQSRIDSLEVHLGKFSEDVAGLNHKIELSVSKIPLEEFVRSIANLTKLNINLSTTKKQFVTNNFTDVPAKDVLLFLCKYYDLELEFTGNIIHVKDFVQTLPPYVPKKLNIEFDTTQAFVKLDLRQDSLCLLAKQLTILSGGNIICEPEVVNRTVSIYVQNLPIKDALDKLAIANNLKISKKDETFVIEGVNIESRNQSRATNNRSTQARTGQSDLVYKIYDKEHLDVYGTNIPIHSSIETISKKLNLNYFIFSTLEGTTNLNLTNVSYDEFLQHILKGSGYTARPEKGIYLIGERATEGLRENRVIHLKYRSVVELSKVIPEDIVKDVIVKEFPDLNSLILSGSAPGIAEIVKFIEKIDKVVPMVLIEVMIIDNQSGYSIETGISAGMNDSPVQSSGQIYPTTNYTMSDQSINSIINSFNGFGTLNLGKVNPNFYVNIKAMEDEGIVKVRSTPKLSTLNGHEAELTIGKTEYYVEERSDFIVNQSTQQRSTTQYKPINADFNLKILPVVSGNDEITLQISVEQSDFTARIEKNAPPGKVNRSFNSLIRVKNEETILLGGLEEKSKNNSGSGVPFLSRIPVLKWFFSSRKKEKNETKLNIFIKPTIIY